MNTCNMHQIALASLMCLIFCDPTIQAFPIAPVHGIINTSHGRSCLGASRRDVLQSAFGSLTAGAFLVAGFGSQEANAAQQQENAALITAEIAATAAATATGVSTTDPTQARVLQYPALELLEPLWELKVNVDRLATEAEDEERWPTLEAGLERFFKGGFLSMRNYYGGMSYSFITEIKYNDPRDLPTRDQRVALRINIVNDQDYRQNCMEKTLDSMERMKDGLGKKQRYVVLGAADEMKLSCNQYFALLPPADVDFVSKLYTNVKKADIDENGKLSEKELASLSGEEAVVWKKRTELFGESV